MRLIFGLGNPEPRFDGTRHNVGFRMLDGYAKKQGIAFTAKPKFYAEIAELNDAGEKLLLVKPTTFYNDSGLSYRALIDFYKLSPEDTLVIHDELALPFGTVRMRRGGSDAGNNGVKSINSHGGEASARIRIGVANELRQTIGDVDFVLGRFSKSEAVHLDLITRAVMEDIDKFIRGAFTDTSYKLAPEQPIPQEG